MTRLDCDLGENKSISLHVAIAEKLSKEFGGTWRFHTNAEKNSEFASVDYYKEKYDFKEVQKISEAYAMTGERLESCIAIYVKVSQP